MDLRYSRKYPKSSLPKARKLRKELTTAERKLWSLLRRDKLGSHFRKQVPIGPYIVDFFSTGARLVLELDGSQHLSHDKIEQDLKRDAYLRNLGFTVLRFHNNEVLGNPSEVCLAIQEHLLSKLHS